MNKLRCLIIDDEPLARKVVKEMAEDTGLLEVAGCCENIDEAEAILASSVIDLLFLDIEMYGTNGLTYLRNTTQDTGRQDTRPLIIITTAYPQYALEGFDLNVLDYLVKPISSERFLKAVQKAKNYHEMKAGSNDDHLFVKCAKKMEKIFLRDILYVEAMANYVVIHTPGKKFITYLSFKSVESQLKDKRFIKTHRSYLIPIDRIERIEGETVVIGDKVLPLVKSAKEELMSKLQGTILKK